MGLFEMLIFYLLVLIVFVAYFMSLELIYQVILGIIVIVFIVGLIRSRDELREQEHNEWCASTREEIANLDKNFK